MLELIVIEIDDKLFIFQFYPYVACFLFFVLFL